MESAYLPLKPTKQFRATEWRGGGREKDQPSLVSIPRVLSSTAQEPSLVSQQTLPSAFSLSQFDLGFGHTRSKDF